MEERPRTNAYAKACRIVEKVRDIVGLYVSPPERAVVLCIEPRGSPDVDEKSQIRHWISALAPSSYAGIWVTP